MTTILRAAGLSVLLLLSCSKDAAVVSAFSLGGGGVTARPVLWTSSSSSNSIKTMARPTTTTALRVESSASGVDPVEVVVVVEEEEILKSRLVKLNAALRQFNSTEAADLLAEFKTIRDSSIDIGSRQQLETVLDELLEQGPDNNRSNNNKLPLRSHNLRFMTRFSQRARLASCRRTLDWTTPPMSQEDAEVQDNADVQDTLENSKRRRRQALTSLLRTLAQSADEAGFAGDSKIPAIRQIEIQAVQEFKMTANSQQPDMLVQRRPAGLETPNYTVVTTTQRRRRRGDKYYYEVRNYEPFAVCSVSMNQERAADPRTDASLNEPAKGGVKAFGALAGYLFGKNEDKKAMKMTTPVLTSADEDTTSKRMSFILPSVYWNTTDDAATATASQPPRPLVGSGVRVERVAGGERAVHMFGGYAARVDQRQEELIDQLSKDAEWQVVPGERPILAQYNDPFTPPWKRLNEVSVAVQSRSLSSNEQ